MSGERLFGTSITPACKYCEHIMQAFDSDNLLCDKRGVVESAHKCRHFIYDPLKRIPKKPVNLVSIEQFEFEL